MELGTILAAGWTSGLSLYATALMVGIAGRFGWIDSPATLSEPGTLIVLAVLTTVEFVIDKVPWIDTVWDTAHLFIRPIGGGALTGLLATQTDSPELLLAMVGGTFALSAHGAKSSTRALANTSPEPVSNIVLSFAEDGIVVGMVTLAVAFPVVAGVLAVTFAIACVVATWVAFRLVGRARRALGARREAARLPSTGRRR